MKKTAFLALALSLAAALSGCGENGGGFSLWPVLFALLAVVFLALAGLRTYSIMEYNRRRNRGGRRRRKRTIDPVTWGMFGVGGISLLMMLVLCIGPSGSKPAESTPPSTQESTDPVVRFSAQKTAQSDPNNWTIRWEIFENGTLTHNYDRAEKIYFSDPEDYFALPGIATFRGNNYRDNPTYGTANVAQMTMMTAWTKDSTALPGGIWEGSGWTGQPLIVQWDAETRNLMNLYADKKAKENLVEVIYATLDGHIYFLDLDDGTPTRDPIYLGMAFKGSGSLDPRGYPLMYVGSGDVNAEGKRPRMFIISLLDGKTLYEYGHEETLSYRTDNENWCAFDSSPLVDAETDTLIWPGENGVLYTIKLNTQYDKTAQTLSVTPDTPVLTRYLTGRTGSESYWSGYEASACIVDSLLYVSENGGMFYCVDLNTMELLWAQDTKDDSNASPVFERVSETEGYLYTAPSLHWTQDSSANGSISLYKINAVTGEIVWEKPYTATTVDGVSGGVQSTPLLGRKGTNLEGLVIYSISRNPSKEKGLLVALDTATGEEKWKVELPYYAWSSPVAVYDSKGNGYILLCDSGSDVRMFNASGALLSTLDLPGLIEASPAVYNNMLVVGTRGKKICAVRIY